MRPLHVSYMYSPPNKRCTELTCCNLRYYPQAVGNVRFGLHLQQRHYLTFLEVESISQQVEHDRLSARSPDWECWCDAVEYQTRLQLRAIIPYLAFILKKIIKKLTIFFLLDVSKKESGNASCLDLYFVVQSRPFKGNHFHACQPPRNQRFFRGGDLVIYEFLSDFESTLLWRKGYEKLWQAPHSLRSN